MIKVKITLHSAIDGHEEELGSLDIWNDGTGSKTKGNYEYRLLSDHGKIFRSGRITGYPRRLSAPNLVYRVLKRAVGEFND